MAFPTFFGIEERKRCFFLVQLKRREIFKICIFWIDLAKNKILTVVFFFFSKSISKENWQPNGVKSFFVTIKCTKLSN